MKNADNSECRDWEEIVALNTKWKMLMALNAELRIDSGFECQMGNVDGSKRRDWEEIVALNAKWKMLMALNAETEKK